MRNNQCLGGGQCSWAYIVLVLLRRMVLLVKSRTVLGMDGVIEQYWSYGLSVLQGNSPVLDDGFRQGSGFRI